MFFKNKIIFYIIIIFIFFNNKISCSQNSNYKFYKEYAINSAVSALSFFTVYKVFSYYGYSYRSNEIKKDFYRGPVLFNSNSEVFYGYEFQRKLLPALLSGFPLKSDTLLIENISQENIYNFFSLSTNQKGEGYPLFVFSINIFERLLKETRENSEKILNDLIIFMDKEISEKSGGFLIIPSNLIELSITDKFIDSLRINYCANIVKLQKKKPLVVIISKIVEESKFSDDNEEVVSNFDYNVASKFFLINKKISFLKRDLKSGEFFFIDSLKKEAEKNGLKIEKELESKLFLGKGYTKNFVNQMIALIINNALKKNKEIINKDHFLAALRDMSVINFVFTSFDKSKKFTFFIPEKEKTFEDFIGNECQKKEMEDLLKLFLDKNSKKYNVPKGVLFNGPPGVGKTYLAHIISQEAGLPIIFITPSEFESMYVGGTQENISLMFKKAEEIAKVYGGAIIFLDEFDSIGSRTNNNEGSHASYLNKVVNTFLVEMDKTKNVFTIGATNYAERLDPAILRAGRFDRVIQFSFPSEEDRKLLFNYYLKEIPMEQDIDINYLVKLTKDFSSASIKGVVNQALFYMSRDNKDLLTKEYLVYAYEDILEKNTSLKVDETLSFEFNTDNKNKETNSLDKIIGLKEEKEEIQQIINLLNNREKAISLGIKIPKGIAFSGSPGTGKTFLAKAIAQETRLPFLYGTSSDFLSKWVGEGEKKVKSMFEKARNLSKRYGGAIIIIDEADSFGNRKKEGGRDSSLINTFLAEMDGFKDNEGILIIFISNFYESLDEALRRPGRIDRVFHFKLPSLEDRKLLILHFLKNKKYSITEAEINNIVDLTSELSPVDIKQIIENALFNQFNKKEDILKYLNIKYAYEELIKNVPSKSKAVNKKNNNIVDPDDLSNFIKVFFTNIKN